MIHFESINGGRDYTGNVSEDLIESLGHEYKMVTFTDEDGEGQTARLYIQDVPRCFPFMDSLNRNRTVLTTQGITFRLKLCSSEREGLNYYRAYDALAI